MLKVKVRYTGPTTSKMTGPESDAQGEGQTYKAFYKMPDLQDRKFSYLILI